MKKKEWLIVILIFVFAIAFYVFLIFSNANKKFVSVRNGAGEILLKFDINEDNYYSLKGEYGDFSIEVKNQKCRAIDVDCPNHNCVNVGWISVNNPLPIICIPNNIVVKIDE